MGGGQKKLGNFIPLPNFKWPDSPNGYTFPCCCLVGRGDPVEDPAVPIQRRGRDLDTLRPPSLPQEQVRERGRVIDR